VEDLKTIILKNNPVPTLILDGSNITELEKVLYGTIAQEHAPILTANLTTSCSERKLLSELMSMIPRQHGLTAFSKGLFLMEKKVEPSIIVTIDKRFYDLMTPDELNACIWHENGHIYYDHLQEEEHNFSKYISHEIEADDFALKQGVEKYALISSLQKAVEFIADHYFPNDREDFIKHQTTSLTWKLRTRAINACTA
jgi:hypothetical protein